MSSWRRIAGYVSAAIVMLLAHRVWKIAHLPHASAGHCSAWVVGNGSDSSSEVAPGRRIERRIPDAQQAHATYSLEFPNYQCEMSDGNLEDCILCVNTYRAKSVPRLSIPDSNLQN